METLSFFSFEEYPYHNHDENACDGAKRSLVATEQVSAGDGSVSAASFLEHRDAKLVTEPDWGLVAV
jgi:hypothetical protein